MQPMFPVDVFYNIVKVWYTRTTKDGLMTAVAIDTIEQCTLARTVDCVLEEGQAKHISIFR